MNKGFINTIKRISKEVFQNNKGIIIDEWLKRVNEEDIIDDEMEMDIVRQSFEKLVEDFVKYLSAGDLDGYYIGNEQIACSIAYNDISFEKFLKLFHLFEDSYLDLLVDLSNEDFRRSIASLDKLHHNTIASVSGKYFEIRDDMIFALTKLIELRDCETAEHIERTKKYSIAIARDLGQDENFIHSLSKASMLHDIGKVAVRDSILLKPGKLTNEEFDEIKKHTVIGANAIEDMIKNQKIDRGYLLMARDIALYHHEKFDGSGYPEGLKGNEIPLCARILALVDAYDTIVSKRPYKEGFSHEEAVRRIVGDAGKHFDPEVVKAFLNVHDTFYVLHG